jgi:hypothetical protein
LNLYLLLQHSRSQIFCSPVEYVVIYHCSTVCTSADCSTARASRIETAEDTIESVRIRLRCNELMHWNVRLQGTNTSIYIIHALKEFRKKANKWILTFPHFLHRFRFSTNFRFATAAPWHIQLAYSEFQISINLAAKKKKKPSINLISIQLAYPYFQIQQERNVVPTLQYTSITN